jgi:phosphatidylserine decarboxylase
MTEASPLITRIVHNERLNFLLTNRIPRELATRLMGWFSRLEHPLLVRLSLAAWQWFGGDLNLHEAKRSRFVSVHDCFVRELKEGARPVDHRPEVIVSPCDGIVAACGRIDGTTLIQAKGSTYTLEELLVDPELAALHRNGTYVTLRLRSTMYHRFHAPADCGVDRVIYVAGDLWNVNPAALRRIQRLYCRNERAIAPARLRAGGEPLTLVPVAAILVASIRLHFLDVVLNVKYRGPNRLACQASFAKGEELGCFHHGSTVIVLTSSDLDIWPSIREGELVLAGQPLFSRIAALGEQDSARA